MRNNKKNNLNGPTSSQKTSAFYRNVFLGAFFSSNRVTDEKIKCVHESAVETHIECMKIHEETQKNISETERLLDI